MKTPLVHPPELLARAEPLLTGPERIDWLEAGMLTRLALETHTRLMVQQRSLRWRPGPWYIRLRVAGVIGAGDVATLRELFELGARAVHNNPFGQAEARLLFGEVQAFIANRS